VICLQPCDGSTALFFDDRGRCGGSDDTAEGAISCTVPEFRGFNIQQEDASIFGGVLQQLAGLQQLLQEAGAAGVEGVDVGQSCVRCSVVSEAVCQLQNGGGVGV